MKKCRHYLLCADVINFFATRKCRKMWKIWVIWMIWEISMKFSEKMWTMIILNVTKKQWFTFYLEDTFFEKPLVGVKSTFPRLFGVNQYCQYLNLPTSNQSSQSNQLFLDWFVGLLVYSALFNYNIHAYIHA